MATLGVNIDHVATLRQARGGEDPNIAEAAAAAEAGGGQAITVHLREDRRHIQDHDVYTLRDSITTRLNLEMAATDEMLEIALDVLPACCCIVPEKREELTTEGGLDVIAQRATIGACCERLRAAGIEVSLFIDPDLRQIEGARAANASTVEIHTGSYANADTTNITAELGQIARAVEFAQACGLQANAGHGLNYTNVSQVASLTGIAELNIGHSIVSRAVQVGLQSAVAEMAELIQKASR